MDNVSVYFCKNCENHTGLFFGWDELESEEEPTCCCVCGSDDIEFKRDIEISL